MIYIYYSYIEKEIHNKLLKKHLRKFPVDYQNKILRFKRWEDAQLSLLGRLLLIYGMNHLDKNYDNYQLEYTDYHKPYFTNSDLKFNISHSGNIAVFVISQEFEVGIDVELISDIKIEGFKNQMTAGEWERVNCIENKVSAFYEYWTKKEAVVKALGRGLSIPLKSFEIVDGKTSIKNSLFVVKEVFMNKDYKCSLALMKKKDSKTSQSFYHQNITIKQVNFHGDKHK